jgi:hypothetical protein
VSRIVLIVSEWGTSENNRRARFYRLTALGRKHLSAERENWQKITSAVALVSEFWKGIGRGDSHGLVISLARNLWKEKLTREHEEELQFHLSISEQLNVEQGMAHGEARRDARLRFGNPSLWRERMNDIDLTMLPASNEPR